MSHGRQASGAGEDGLTLVELLVVMAISLLVAGLVLGFLQTTTSAVARTSNDVQAENDARLALRTMTQDIRAADPSSISFTSSVAGACPTTPTPGTCLSFTILRDTAAAPTCRSTVTYGLFTDHVQQTRNNANCPTTASIARPLISSLSNGTTPLFTYYDDQGNLLSSGQDTAKAIKVTVVVTYTGGKGPLTLTSTLALRNARWEPS
jgi:prepilin-type N-terminal cleavage/methylation domain-containing protein